MIGPIHSPYFCHNSATFHIYRYWWGRCAWSDLIKNSRTMSRLIWIHVPPRLRKVTSVNSPDLPPAPEPSFREETGQAMREKRMMMDLIEAYVAPNLLLYILYLIERVRYAVSLKHYVRGWFKVILHTSIQIKHFWTNVSLR